MELQIINALSFVCKTLKKIQQNEEQIKRREKDFEDLTLLSTRLTIIRECHRYIDKGFAPVYARSSISDIYEKYHALGGNGGIESLYKEFLKLPVKEGAK